MEIRLQKATESDIPKMVEIEKKLVGTKIYSGTTTEEEWKEELAKDNNFVFVILKNGEVVGDASYEKKVDGTAYISGLAIAPEFQKQGIARKVMEI